MQENKWIADIRTCITLDILPQYAKVFELVQQV